MKLAHLDDPWTAGGGIVLAEADADALASTRDWTLECALRPRKDGPERLDPALGPLLDAEGVVRVGAEVRAGDVLVAKVSASGQDRALRMPPWSHAVVVEVRETAALGEEPRTFHVDLRSSQRLTIGDDLAVDGVPVRVRAVGVARSAWAGPAGEHDVVRTAIAAEVLHARSIGPYSLITQQPLSGRDAFGGQSVTEDDVSCALAAGAPTIALEWLCAKSDGVPERVRLYENLVRGDGDLPTGVPEAARMLAAELGALGLSVELELGDPTLFVAPADWLADAGTVSKPETLNYRTLKPEKHGLFCEVAFGTDPVERRTRLAKVDLALPLVNPLFEDAVARLLGFDRAAFDRLLEGTDELVDGAIVPAGESAGLDPARTGAGPVLAALRALDLDALQGGNKLAALVAGFRARGASPDELVWERLPVLPPDLRPLVPLGDGRWATSDANDLYRRVVNRNHRLRRLIELGAPPPIVANELRLFREAVAHLVDNRTEPYVGEAGRPLRDLSAMVRARCPVLLRRRVDYSGVAVVVPDPDRAPGRVGLPRLAARELLKPLVFCRLERDGHVARIKEAKALVTALDPRAEAALDEVAAERPLVLARPGKPLLVGVAIDLVDGPALRLHPDLARRFDGTAVFHLPCSDAAVAEARGLDAEALLPPSTSEGWLARAMRTEDPVPGLVRAALAGAADPLDDPRVAVAIGRRP